MKKLTQVLAILFALGLTAVAQNGYPDRDRDRDHDHRYAVQNRMSAEDQRAFDREYQEWQRANSKNDRDDIDKHARRMEDIMARYNIPPDTPFDAVASNGYGRYEGDRGSEGQGRFSPDDQKRFDRAYEHWQNARRKNDRDDVSQNERKMQEIMARYNIPRDVPYDELVSGGRRY